MCYLNCTVYLLQCAPMCTLTKTTTDEAYIGRRFIMINALRQETLGVVEDKTAPALVCYRLLLVFQEANNRAYVAYSEGQGYRRGTYAMLFTNYPHV